MKINMLEKNQCFILFVDCNIFIQRVMEKLIENI